MPDTTLCKCGHATKFPNPYEPWTLCEDCLMEIGTIDAVRAVVWREMCLSDRFDHLFSDAPPKELYADL